MSGIRSAFQSLLPRVAEAAPAHYGDNLVSLAVFGSVARGVPRPDSDVDLLLVCRDLPRGHRRRRDGFELGDVDAAGAHGQPASPETAGSGQGGAGEGDGFVPYEEVPHTADWALRARGRTLEELFVNAARGMYWLMAEELPAAAPVARTVEVEAASAEGLLVAWLNELIYLTEREGLVLTGFRVRELAVPGRESATARLRAEVAGDRSRTGLRKYIKAATYHNLAIERRGGLYEATVVFDV